ncbi:MAG: hypothetical protein WAL67_02565 [Candidatus Cybelea sp.]
MKELNLREYVSGALLFLAAVGLAGLLGGPWAAYTLAIVLFVLLVIAFPFYYKP